MEAQQVYIKTKPSRKTGWLIAICFILTFIGGIVIGSGIIGRRAPTDPIEYAERIRAIELQFRAELEEQREHLDSVLNDLRSVSEYSDDLERRIRRANELAGDADELIGLIRSTAAAGVAEATDLGATVRALTDNHRRITAAVITLQSNNRALKAALGIGD